MSINNEQDANKYICYLAANIWKFAYWAENEWPGRDKGDRENQDGNNH